MRYSLIIGPDGLRRYGHAGDGVLVDLDATDAADAPLSGCCHRVTLLIDSPGEDIDTAIVSGRRWSWRYRRDRRALINRLLDADPDAEHHRAVLDPAREAIVVVRRHTPESWQACIDAAWAASLQEVRSLSTAVAMGGPHGKAVALYVIRDTDHVRHLFCRGAVTCFSRQVPCRDVDASLDALDESLEHLASSGLLGESMILLHAGLSDEEERRICFHPGFVEHRALAMSAGDAIVGDVLRACALDDRHDPRRGLRRLQQLPGLLSPVAGNDPWRQGWRARQQRLWRRGVVLALVALLLPSTTLAVLKTHHVVQERSRIIDEAARLADAGGRLRSAAADMHHAPMLGATILEARERLQEVFRPSTPSMLVALAPLFTRHPALTLDAVGWQPGSDPMGVSLSTDSPSPARLPAADPGRSRWQVRLQGAVTDSLSLREQQMRFDAFVAQLEDQAWVTALRVEQAPADAEVVAGRRDRRVFRLVLAVEQHADD